MSEDSKIMLEAELVGASLGAFGVSLVAGFVFGRLLKLCGGGPGWQLFGALSAVALVFLAGMHSTRGPRLYQFIAAALAVAFFVWRLKPWITASATPSDVSAGRPADTAKKWGGRVLWAVVFVAALVGAKTLKTYWFDPQAEGRAVAEAGRHMDQMRQDAIKARPDLPVSEAVREEAGRQMAKAIALQAGDKAKQASTAADHFWGFLLVNTRTRVDYCKERGVDISPFTRAFENTHRKEIERATAIFSKKGVDKERVFDLLKKQHLTTIEDDMRLIATTHELDLEGACKLLAEVGSEIATAMHLSKVHPAVHNALMNASVGDVVKEVGGSSDESPSGLGQERPQPGPSRLKPYSGPVIPDGKKDVKPGAFDDLIPKYKQKNVFDQFDPPARSEIDDALKGAFDDLIPKDKQKNVLGRLFGPSNYAECLLDWLPKIENDIVARQIIAACYREFPSGLVSIESRTGWLAKYSDGRACLINEAKSTKSPLAAQRIQAACFRLYGPPPLVR